MAKVMIGIPTYDRRIDVAIVASILFASNKGHQVLFTNVNTSANCGGMNTLWIQALEYRDSMGLDYYIQLHADIVPCAHWIDKLIDIQQATKAGIVCAVSPIKDPEKGVTSTALDERPEGYHHWRMRRLTMKEVMARPPTWTEPGLLLNDGCMLVDINAPWCDKVHFHFDDDIVWSNGKRQAVMMPEDWNFSRDAKALGATVYATREVTLDHIGSLPFTNTWAWGKWDTDSFPALLEPDLAEAVKEASKINGYMALEELLWLAEQARTRNVIVEVGSWKGRSTKALAATCPGVVYGVDLWKGSGNGDATGVEATAKGADAIFDLFRANLAKEIGAMKVIPLNIDHAELATFSSPEGVDMVFIDGDHQYEHVKRDIESSLKLLKPGGLLCGHDLNEPGVKQAVEEAFGARVEKGQGSIWKYNVGEPAMATVHQFPAPAVQEC